MQSTGFGMFYADESGQDHPQTHEIGQLVSAGGIYVPGIQAGKLDREIDQICARYGCPPNEEFKWNPPQNSWMRNMPRQRSEFYRELLEACVKSSVEINVVIVAKRSSARNDRILREAFQYLMERVHYCAQKSNEHCGFIADRRSNITKHDDRFVGDLLATIDQGTDYIVPDRILWAVTSDSRNMRGIQMADVVVGATTQFVAGKLTYTKQLLEIMYPMFRKSPNGQINGYGLKIWPPELYVHVPEFPKSQYVTNGVGAYQDTRTNNPFNV